MIGLTLRKLRNIYGYTAVEMSELLKISKSYLSEIEKGSKQPSLELLQRYSEVLGIRMSSLMLFSEEYGKATERNQGQEFIVNLMNRFIDTMERGSTCDEEDQAV